MQGANGSYVGHMHRSSSAAFIWLMFALILAAQGASPALLNAAILKSFADLDAAAQSSPLLLVLFDPFSPRSSSDSHLPGIQCSTKCRELLLLCEGAAALRLPKRSRITCGLAQGDREWMKGLFPNVPAVPSYPPSLLVFVGSSKSAFPVQGAPFRNSSVIASYCLYVQGELLRPGDIKRSMQIFTIASSLHNSSALLQAIASVHYSTGEVAGAYHALHAAASEEGHKIDRVQFWQMYGSTALVMGYFDVAVTALRRGLSLGGDLDAAASMTRELSVALVITRQFLPAARELLRFLSHHPTMWPSLIADAVTFMASVPAAGVYGPLSREASQLLIDFGELLIKLEVEFLALTPSDTSIKKLKISFTHEAPYMWALIASAKGSLFATAAASAAANLLFVAASSASNVSPSMRSQTWNVLGHFLHEVGGERTDAMTALGTASRLRDEAYVGAMSASDVVEHVRATARAESSSSASKDSPVSGTKIFVYSLPPVWNVVMHGLNTDQCRYSIYGAEIFIHEQLIMSPYVTRNASEATHFFVPFYSSCMMSSRFVRPGPGRPNNDVDIGAVMREVKEVQAFIQHNHPWFNMSGGRDHIWPFTTDWASCVAPLTNFAHSIHLVTSGDVSPRAHWYHARARDHMGSSEAFARRVLAPCYTHHKDIVLPPLLSDPHRSHPTLLPADRFIRARKRLVLFRGSLHHGNYSDEYSYGVRQELLRFYSGIQGWTISAENHPEYVQELQSHIFCLIPPGWELWSVRFFEAVAAGCLPILVGCDGIVLPFESSSIRYSDFVMRVPRSQLHQILDVVNALIASPERVQRMRSAMESAWMGLTWQRTLIRRGNHRGLDAFDLLLREIGKRRR